MKKKGRGREHIKEMMASLGNFETPNFETLGEIDASQNAQYENSGSGKMSRSPRFLSTHDERTNTNGRTSERTDVKTISLSPREGIKISCRSRTNNLQNLSPDVPTELKVHGTNSVY